MTIWCVVRSWGELRSNALRHVHMASLHSATVEAWQTAAASERITAGLHELCSDPRSAAAVRHAEGWPVRMLTAEVKPRHA